VRENAAKERLAPAPERLAGASEPENAASERLAGASEGSQARRKVSGPRGAGGNGSMEDRPRAASRAPRAATAFFAVRARRATRQRASAGQAATG
jgi:hypothetical protein